MDAWGFRGLSIGYKRRDSADYAGSGDRWLALNAALKSSAGSARSGCRLIRVRWQTPHERDPRLRSRWKRNSKSYSASDRRSQEGDGIFASGSNISFRSEDKYFASSVGSSIQQLESSNVRRGQRHRADGYEAGDYKDAPVSASAGYFAGYEYVATMNLAENGRLIRVRM